MSFSEYRASEVPTRIGSPRARALPFAERGLPPRARLPSLPCVFTLLVICVPATSLGDDGLRLTDDGLLKRGPVVWPDARSIVYSVEQPSGRMKLVRLDLESGDTRFLHDVESLSDRELSVSADGKRYAYNVVTGGKGISTDLLIRDVGNDEVIRLPVKRWSHWPTLSPDGRHVLFAENAQKLWLYRIDPKAYAEAEKVWLEEERVRFEKEKRRYEEEKARQGAERAKGDPEPEERKKNRLKEPKPKKPDPKEIALRAGLLTEVADQAYWPRFSPDGRRIVASSRRDDDVEIYVMNRDGADPRRLTTSRGVDAHPVFSPDGERIAFTSNRDGNQEIYVMSAGGEDIVRLTEHEERDMDPYWHPNGRQLVIVSERRGRFDLYLVNVPES